MRDKVLERPQSTPGLSHLKLREDDICFMPHEDVQLVCKSDISTTATTRVSSRLCNITIVQVKGFIDSINIIMP